MKRALFMLLAAAAAVGCSKSDEGIDLTEKDVTAIFSAEQISTRTTATDLWEPGDLIGIFTEGFTADYNNVSYTASTTADAAQTNFAVTTAGEQILFPNVDKADQKSVSFYAYYPYIATANTTDKTLSVSVAGQSTDIGSVDFMTARSTDYGYGVGTNYSDVELTFSHNLAQVVMNISCNANLAALTGLTTTLNNIETIGEYNYTTGAKTTTALSGVVAELPLMVAVNSSDATKATVTAILHPATYTTPTLTFVVGSNKYSVTFATELSAGKSHTFNIALGNDMPDFVSGATIGAWDPATNTDQDDLVPQTSDIALVNEVYQIYTAKGLQEFAALVNDDGKANIAGKLMNNIDLYTICSSSLALSWSPIGSEATPYNGTFDGNGKVITRLYISDTVNGYKGLFGSLGESAEVQKLGVEGTVVGLCFVGGIAGCNNGKISSCYFIGMVDGRDTDTYVGGIVGENRGSITNCYHRGKVYGTDYIGGVAGKSSSEEASLTRCYHVGEVDAYDNNNFGGVVAEANSNVTNCYFDRDVDGDPSPTNGLTTSVMQTELLGESYFNNTTDWAYDSERVNEGYPVLIW